MTDRTLPAVAIVSAGVGLGFAANQLTRGTIGPGLNILILAVGLAMAIWAVTQSRGMPLSREGWGWIVVGVLCAAAMVWRGSGLLRFGAFVAGLVAFALPALQGGRAWVRRSGVLDPIEAVLGSGIHAGFGSFRLLNREHWENVGSDESRKSLKGVLRSGVVAALLAAIPLVIFSALFMSADAVFATIVRDVVRVDLETLASHTFVIGILSWLACGYLVGIASGSRLGAADRVRSAGPKFGVTEVALALGLVDLLFVGFVAVQFRYLFGGASWVLVTEGLTYAEYARSGFFQLVAAVALALPWLLATHALLNDGTLKGRTVFAALGGINVVLLFAIVASAFQRMMLYQAAYGLTELRVIVTATLIWLTVVLALFSATVFSGRRDRFAFGVLATGFLLVGALQVVNPAGLVTRHNLDRSDLPGGVDVEYLARAGSDAVPALLASIDDLPTEAQCTLGADLVRRWGDSSGVDWRSYNAADHRARVLVQASAGDLNAYSSRWVCRVFD